METTGVAKFRGADVRLGALMKSEGWTLSTYRGADELALATCPVGHEVLVDVRGWRRKRSCKMCPTRPQVRAERKFHAKLNELGATLLTAYSGSMRKVEILCGQGHVCVKTPNAIMNGRDLCSQCRVSATRMFHPRCFYVVCGNGFVKPGVANIDRYKHRLGVHRRDGFCDVRRLWVGLPGDTSRMTELRVLSQLESLGIRPVKGDEYFDAEHTSDVLRVVDALLGTFEQFRVDVGQFNDLTL